MMERRHGASPVTNERGSIHMAMKSPTSPRRVYSTQGTLALCFEGTLFAAPEGTKCRKGVPAVVISSDPEEGTIKVKQRKAHAKAVTETWTEL